MISPLTPLFIKMNGMNGGIRGSGFGILEQNQGKIQDESLCESCGAKNNP